MTKYFFAFVLSCICLGAYGQIDYKAIKKNHYRFDCRILQTVIKDSTVFSRKTRGRDKHPIIINDFNHYFENCAIAPIFNRQVVVINRALNPRSDTTAILTVSRDGDNYVVDFLQPSTGSNCKVELLKVQSEYKVQKITSGAY